KRHSVGTDSEQWTVRQEAAEVLANMASHFASRVPLLRANILVPVCRALRSLEMQYLPAHYGALQVLLKMGPTAIRDLLVPLFPSYLDWLDHVECLLLHAVKSDNFLCSRHCLVFHHTTEVQDSCSCLRWSTRTALRSNRITLQQCHESLLFVREAITQGERIAGPFKMSVGHDTSDMSDMSPAPILAQL